MRRRLAILAALLAVLVAAASGVAGADAPPTLPLTGSIDKGDEAGYSSELPSTTTAGIYRIGPSYTVGDVYFTQADQAAGGVYACDSIDPDTNGDDSLADESGCDSVCSLSASTTCLGVKIGRSEILLQLDTAESSGNTSRLTIRGSNEQVALGEAWLFDEFRDGTVYGAGQGTDENDLPTVGVANANYPFSAHFGGSDGDGVGGSQGGYLEPTTNGGNSYKVWCYSAPDGLPSAASLNADVLGRKDGTPSIYEGACRGAGDVVKKYSTADAMLGQDFAVRNGKLLFPEFPEATRESIYHFAGAGWSYLTSGGSVHDGRDPRGDGAVGNNPPLLREPYNTRAARMPQMGLHGVQWIKESARVRFVDDHGQQEEGCASGTSCLETREVHSDSDMTPASGESFAIKGFTIGLSRGLVTNCVPVSATDPRCVATASSGAQLAVGFTPWGHFTWPYGENPRTTRIAEGCLLNSHGTDPYDPFPSDTDIDAYGRIDDMPLMLCDGDPRIRATTSNQYCTASSTPYSCCTGDGTGTCDARATTTTGGCDFGAGGDLGPALSIVDLIEHRVEDDGENITMLAQFTEGLYGSEGTVLRNNNSVVSFEVKEVIGDPQSGATAPTTECGIPDNSGGDERGRAIQFGDPSNSASTYWPFPGSWDARARAVGTSVESYFNTVQVIDEEEFTLGLGGVYGGTHSNQDWRGRETCPYASAKSDLGDADNRWCDSTQTVLFDSGFGGVVNGVEFDHISSEGHAAINGTSENINGKIRDVIVRDSDLWGGNLVSARYQDVQGLKLLNNTGETAGAIFTGCTGQANGRDIYLEGNFAGAILNFGLSRGCHLSDVTAKGNNGALFQAYSGAKGITLSRFSVMGHRGLLGAFQQDGSVAGGDAEVLADVTLRDWSVRGLLHGPQSFPNAVAAFSYFYGSTRNDLGGVSRVVIDNVDVMVDRQQNGGACFMHFDDGVAAGDIYRPEFTIRDSSITEQGSAIADFGGEPSSGTGSIPATVVGTLNANILFDLATPIDSATIRGAAGWQAYPLSVKYVADPDDCWIPILGFLRQNRIQVTSSYPAQAGGSTCTTTGANNIEFEFRPSARFLCVSDNSSTMATAENDTGSGFLDGEQYRPVLIGNEVNGARVPDNTRSIAAVDVPDAELLDHGTTVKIHDDTAVGACTDAGPDGLLDGGGSATSTCVADPSANAGTGGWSSI